MKKTLKIKKNVDREWLPNWWRVYDSEGYNIAFFKFRKHAVEYKKLRSKCE